jgi:multisubunit Na+/H+ antiporter MnhF subunit
MSAALEVALQAALVVHVAIAAVSVWRLWRGENVIDRMIGSDLLVTLTLAILVLLALIHRDSIYIDLALALAAVGFVGTIAFAKYIADQQLF